jgi:geranylgeranyl diphosphate synthase, type II
MKMSSELLTEPLSELRGFLAQCRSAVDAGLDRFVPAEETQPTSVHQAMRWSLFAGGKRLRPALLLAVGSSLGASHDDLLASACALEMVHTYSLIHDDLPSMDDDDLRRGRPTCHVRFGEATATLAGDALQTLAFQTIAEDEHLSADKRLRVINELARGAGTPHGMVAGQARDLEAESRVVSASELDTIHQLKTGALIVTAARSGAIIAGADEPELSAITDYAAGLGLLFQITDDLLDVTATAQDLGKTPGKDARAEKATYPALYGIESARLHAVEIHEKVRATLSAINRPTDLLMSIADYILRRNS